MSQLSIANVVNVTVSQPPAGLQDYKINSIAYFTKEVPINPLTNGWAVYLEPQSVGVAFGTGSETYAAAVQFFLQAPNPLSGDGRLIVFTMAGGDTLSTILATAAGLIYFGAAFYGGYAPNDAEILAGATAFQAAKKMLFYSQNLVTAVQPGGIIYVIQQSTLTYARGLLRTTSALDARMYAASYVGRAMSVDFNAANTTITMHLKDLIGITPDPGIDQTTLTLCDAAGADVYPTIAGLPKVWSSSGNGFFDQIYGTLWLVFALQVAYFNTLATSPTKIPQTEGGMTELRNGLTNVLQAGVNNGFIAPGAWNSPQLFGNAGDLRQNILERGYYVYTAPVNQQSQTQRAARVAPLAQLAVKLGGAIHSGNVTVYLNP